MTEHSDQTGFDHPYDHDDSGHDSPLDAGHEQTGSYEHSDLFGHGHELETGAPADHDTVATGAEDLGHAYVEERSAAEIALSGPGGSVFDLLPAAEPASLSDHAPAQALREGHYAAAWASDDGTGVIAVLQAGEVPPGADAAPSGDRFSSSIATHVSELVYGRDSGPAEMAARLWSEFAPGTPQPTDAAGQPLTATALLGALSRELDDPAARSVVEAWLSDLSPGAADG